MMAEIYRFCDYQSKREVARMQADLERQAVEIANMAFPSMFAEYSEAARKFNMDATQANAFHAPESDPA
jgi:hypothetical protein